jgi:hypothetical protein
MPYAPSGSKRNERRRRSRSRRRRRMKKIFSTVMYGCETLSLTLRDLRRIFGP